MSVTKKGPGLGDLEKRLRRLARTNVLVGIPSKTASRGDGPNNAELAYIHENGAPKAGIPPRPFLKPGVAAARDGVTRLFRKGVEAALRGDDHRPFLGSAGQHAVNEVRGMFVDNDWPPIQDRSVEGRFRRRKKKGAALKKAVRDQGTARPLIDTGALRRSITYEVREG